ncbi:hypothetical protein FRB95_003412 [Tulasnella sp. JGI-2019a]|nr:hypothetical protein FRB95_003412 [Tulasnella sp. JGI-2019a]
MAVRWHYPYVTLVDRFIKYCPSSNIQSIQLPRSMDSQLGQLFWTWLKNQTKVKELFLPWNCNPLPSNITLFAFPNLENLAAGPEVTRKLLPALKSIRSFCGQSIFDYSSSPLWSLEDLVQVIQQFGEGQDSIRGVKVLGLDVIPLLRLLRACCPFVKIVHFEIDPSSIDTSSDNTVAALHGFLYLEELFLMVDYGANKETTVATIATMAQGCPKLRFVEWKSFTPVSRTTLRCRMIEGSWSGF